MSLRLKLLAQPVIGQYQVFGGRSWRWDGTGDVGAGGTEMRSFLMWTWLERMLGTGDALARMREGGDGWWLHVTSVGIEISSALQLDAVRRAEMRD